MSFEKITSMGTFQPITNKTARLQNRTELVYTMGDITFVNTFFACWLKLFSLTKKFFFFSADTL